MLSGPVLKNGSEIGTNPVGLVHGLLGVILQVILDRVGAKHKVENQALVLSVFRCDTDYIPDMLSVGRDDPLADVPSRFLHQVPEKDDLDLVQHENLANGLQNLMHGIARPILAGLANGRNEGDHTLHLRTIVAVEGKSIF